MIEQTNRQIRSIEKLSNEVKKSMKSQKQAGMDNFFLMSATESACEQQRLSVDSADTPPSM